MSKVMEIDLHGYHPDEIDVLTIVQQAWKSGASEPILF